MLLDVLKLRLVLYRSYHFDVSVARFREDRPDLERGQGGKMHIDAFQPTRHHGLVILVRHTGETHMNSFIKLGLPLG